MGPPEAARGWRPLRNEIEVPPMVTIVITIPEGYTQNEIALLAGPALDRALPKGAAISIEAWDVSSLVVDLPNGNTH